MPLLMRLFGFLIFHLIVFQFFAFVAMAICGYDGYLQVLEYRVRRANAETARNPGQFETSIPDQFGTSSIGQPGYKPTDPTGYGNTQPGAIRTTTTTVVTEYVIPDRGVTSPPAYSADPIQTYVLKWFHCWSPFLGCCRCTVFVRVPTLCHDAPTLCHDAPTLCHNAGNMLQRRS